MSSSTPLCWLSADPGSTGRFGVGRRPVRGGRWWWWRWHRVTPGTVALQARANQRRNIPPMLGGGGTARSVNASPYWSRCRQAHSGSHHHRSPELVPTPNAATRWVGKVGRPGKVAARETVRPCGPPPLGRPSCYVMPGYSHHDPATVTMRSRAAAHRPAIPVSSVYGHTLPPYAEIYLLVSARHIPPLE